MSAQPPALPARLWIALVCFLRVIVDADFALLVSEARVLGALPAPEPKPRPATLEIPAPMPTPAVPTPAAAPAPQGATASEGALHLLALLQREARLLDFCEEELTGYADATIGAAARTVHAGCRTVLKRYFALEPVRAEDRKTHV